SARPRWLIAAIGGTVGGAVGGLLMQFLQPLMGPVSLIFGLPVFGAAVGFGISWAERALSSLRLQILEGPGRGSEFTLGKNTLIGSEGKCTVRLTEAGVAPRHARIFRKGSGLFFEDLGSSAGSVLNERKVAGTAAGVSHGDLITIGKTLLRVNAPGLKTGMASTASLAALAGLCIMGLFPAPSAASGLNAASAGRLARITQVDTSRYPVVDLYAVLPGDLRPGSIHGLAVLEGKKETSLLEVRDLKKGSRDAPLSISIVLDTSSSMRGRKLAEAKDAVYRFSRSIPTEARINLISFNDAVHVISTGLPASLIYRNVADLSASGHTALFDGIVTGSNLIRNEAGRKVVITLTDGMANRGESSMGDAVAAAENDGVSLLFVGLGPDARRVRLGDMAARTGGRAVFTSDPSELSTLFETYAAELSREVLVRYRSTIPDAPVVPVTLRLTSGNTESILNARYLSPRASFMGTSGTSSWVLFLFGFIGPVGLLAAGRLTSYNMAKDPFLLVEGSSRATRLITRVLSNDGMTVPMSIGGKTVLVNNQPVKGTRTLRSGEALTWGDTTILFRKG
ncbi:MAG TPA: VWA domain-containing protein, partial [Proteobacteria bacterium]|nr:VWA domain-containing protein [Pseudomonadota bacterium]